MPILPHTCNKCNHDWETLIIKSTDKEPIACPNCGSKNIKKTIGVTSHNLKGGGWYKDGYTKKRRNGN